MANYGNSVEEVLEKQREEFNTALERLFWERAFCAAIPHYLKVDEHPHEDAAWSADKALMEWRKRWAK